MPRPKLTTPHTCSTPGCGTTFTRGGRVKPKPQCPRCYTRAYRGLEEAPAPAVPAVRVHLSIPGDLAQRCEAYLISGADTTFSLLACDALLAFLDRADAQSAAAARQQGKRG